MGLQDPFLLALFIIQSVKALNAYGISHIGITFPIYSYYLLITNIGVYQKSCNLI